MGHSGSRKCRKKVASAQPQQDLPASNSSLTQEISTSMSMDCGSLSNIDDISMANPLVIEDHSEIADIQADSVATPVLPARWVIKLTECARAMLKDSLPEGLGILESDNEDTRSPSPEESPPRPSSPLHIHLRCIFRTATNKFKLVRTYHGRPARSLNPALLISCWKMFKLLTPTLKYLWLHWKGGKKTKSSQKELQEALLDPGFHIEDLQGVDFDVWMMNWLKNQAVSWRLMDGKSQGPDCHSNRQETYRSFKVRGCILRQRDQAAMANVNVAAEDDAASDDEYPSGRKYYVSGLHHRSLVDIMTEACSGPAAKDYHWHPFEEHWTMPWNPEQKERVYCR
ncbi:hypothetical protein CPB84DRAFT_1821235 [Gymnopilus junonius]|uniref:Uncharacterized protein n=1 Tax=Gymnopilus junonius TaxID=109634 RepID=A0A9P5TUB5_GYMJU|nr:hypothetical protein CPB84DRAFT_1821235 [Gymnopilus junonius]